MTLADERSDDNRPAAPLRAEARRSAARALIAAAGVAVLVLAAVSTASAQTGLRPSDERPEAPAPGEAPAPPVRLLPELPPAPRAGVTSGLAIEVQRIEVVGSTVFSDDELAVVTGPYAGRTLQIEDLWAARDAVTRLYVDAGYVTSGAVLPDQDVADGVLVIQVVEGRLADVEVRGLSSYRKGYVRGRLARAGRAPVRMQTLERELQHFQQSPWVRRIEAVLAPGAQRGESRLLVDVQEASRVRTAARLANDQPPSIGETSIGLDASVANLAGRSDVVSMAVQFSEGLREIQAAYELPVTPFDTRLGLGYQQSDSEVVEAAFSALDIQSFTRTARVSLMQPIHWTPQRQLAAGIVGEYRQSASSVIGEDICLQQNVLDCTPSLAVLRVTVDGLWRGDRNVVAARSTLSLGLEALGATHDPTLGAADGSYVAWLGQAQWVHLLPESLLSTQLVTRFDVQVADDSLLAIEQIAIGGVHSVRGYRENQILRDQGVVGSIEARIPIWREAFGRPRLELVPFVDVGHGWNVFAPTRSRTLAGVGVGLLASPWRWLTGGVYWGQRLTDAAESDEGLQRYGLYFALEARYPGI